jgi:hypothetical protein
MPRSRVVLVQPLGFEPPITVAAAELAKYLPQLAGVEVGALPAMPALPNAPEAEIVLGVSSRLRGLGLGALPRPHDLDDSLAIIPTQGRLYLTGANPRSVLFAVYRLLEELGCVFLRPGPAGEVIPRLKTLRWPEAPIREAASYRHRGICIEGFPRLEHCLALLDWMAKKKMNTWHLEFPYAGVYWERGYRQSQEMDAAVRAAPVSTADSLTIDDRTIAKAKELGMVIHRAGHGWTAATLGYAGIDWNAPPDHALDPAKRAWVAEVNGKREFWRNEPTNTELCYSNPAAREAFIHTVMSYAGAHPEVDVLHVWLSDATNNHCECKACATQSVSDWYLLLINGLAGHVKAAGLPMRIVFLSYFDTLWPPEHQPIGDEHLIFMYAPIRRCYRHALGDSRCGGGAGAARPSLNHVVLPNRNRATAEIARLWKAAGPADSFIFEYYRWAPTWFDAMGMDVGDTAADDMKDLKALGLNGAISNDCIRAFYPLPVLPNAMADGLWNRRFDKEGHRHRHMEAAFGGHAGLVGRYVLALIEAFRRGHPDYHFSLSEGLPPPTEEGCAEAVAAADPAHEDFTARAEQEPDPVIKLSLELVALHAEQVARLARIYQAGHRGDTKRLRALRTEHERRLPEVLRRFDRWVDPFIARPINEALRTAERMAAP